MRPNRDLSEPGASSTCVSSRYSRDWLAGVGVLRRLTGPPIPNGSRAREHFGPVGIPPNHDLSSIGAEFNTTFVPGRTLWESPSRDSQALMPDGRLITSRLEAYMTS